MTDPRDPPLDEAETDALAAEYVLGVLSHEDRIRAGARRGRDPAFAAAVAAWEERLSGLNDAYDPVPAPDLMPRIEARLFGRPARRRRHWLGLIGGAAVAAALVLLVLAVLPPPSPPVLPGLPAPIARIDAEAGDLRFEVRPEAEGLRITRIAGPAAAAGQVHELWLIEGDQPPVSLGLIPGDSVLLARTRPAAGALLAVSLEPAGGSPTGAPTGPVLATGVIGAG